MSPAVNWAAHKAIIQGKLIQLTTKAKHARENTIKWETDLEDLMHEQRAVPQVDIRHKIDVAKLAMNLSLTTRAEKASAGRDINITGLVINLFRKCLGKDRMIISLKTVNNHLLYKRFHLYGLLGPSGCSSVPPEIPEIRDLFKTGIAALGIPGTPIQSPGSSQSFYKDFIQGHGLFSPSGLWAGCSI